jgi:hypothetical protein
MVQNWISVYNIVRSELLTFSIDCLLSSTTVVIQKYLYNCSTQKYCDDWVELWFTYTADMQKKYS